MHSEHDHRHQMDPIGGNMNSINQLATINAQVETTEAGHEFKRARDTVP